MGERQRGNWRAFWSIANVALWAIPGLGPGAGWLARGASLFGAGVTQLMINAMLPLLPGKAVDSPAYSWKHEPNLPANADIPMPIVYGKTRVKPVIKSRHIRMYGTKQYLDVLYSFTGHRVDERVIAPWVAKTSGIGWQVNDEVTMPEFPSKTYICVKQHTSIRNPETLGAEWWKLGHGTAWGVGISDITIDNNPIESYVTATPDIFTFETRPGAAQQSFIAGFETGYDNYPQGKVINVDGPVVDGNDAGIQQYAGVGPTSVITWKRHSLLYLAASYNIEKKDSYNYAGAYPAYVIWSLGDTTYSVSATKPPLGDPWKLIAVFDSAPVAPNKYYDAIYEPPILKWEKPSVVLSNIHNIEIILDFPQGLFRLDWASGKTFSSTATIVAQYREVGTSQWNYFKKIPKWDDGAVFVDYGSNLHIEANTSQSFSVSYSATDRDNYLDTSKHYEIQVYAISHVVIELANLAGVTYSKPDGDGAYRPHTFPGECLLGIRALATGYLQGGFEVTAVIQRSQVKVRDSTGTWVNRAATLHAWAVYDMLVNGWRDHPQYPNMDNEASVIMPVYGCGIDPDRIDYDSFRTWSTYTGITLAGTEPGAIGFRLNTVFDTTMSIWDAIGRVCEEGLASIIPIGSEFRALVDRPAVEIPASASEIRSLFCMGNINEGTFQQSWVDISKKARSIEVHFADAERTPAYDQTTFTVRIPKWDTADEQDSPISMTLYGTTDYIQALAIAKYRLNCNYLLSHMCVLETDVEAMELEVGDVIPVQHDTICGAGGRLAGVTGVPGGIITLTLDKTVTLVAGKQYELWICHSDASRIEKKVGITGSVVTNTITFSAAWVWGYQPKIYDCYAFGEVGSAVKLFRIMSLTMNSEFKFEIAAMGYDVRAYLIDPDDPVAVAAAINYGIIAGLTMSAVGKIAPNLNLPTADIFAHRATLVTLQEVVSLNRTTGQYESSIVVKFTPPPGISNGEWEVSWRDTDMDEANISGIWDSTDSYDVNEIVLGEDGVVYISDKSGNTSEPFLYV